MVQQVTIRNQHLAATISAKGAELISLIPDGGTDVMWSGDPEIWPWHAPNLFPIVGALADDMLVHQGKRYPMKQHGLLRHSLCDLVTEEAEAASFRLTDSDETRAHYPFAFALTVAYRLHVDRLTCGFELHNPADTPLYASIGAHPGFRWPLGDAEPEAHVIVFDQPEPEPIRCLKGRLLDSVAKPSPVEGRVLHLNHPMFDHDALVFDRLASRRLVFGTPGEPAIEIDFADFPTFGVWTKPGTAPFLCLEPWQGHTSPDGFSGEFAEKPGVVRTEPGATRCWNYSIRPLLAFPLQINIEAGLVSFALSWALRD